MSSTDGWLDAWTERQMDSRDDDGWVTTEISMKSNKIIALLFMNRKSER